jgi:phosphoribosyl-ATP pyrophosphohydrolase
MNFITAYLQKKEQDSNREQYRKQLLKDIDRITKRLSEAENLFNLAADDDLIEAVIYEEKSLQARYAYLLKLARQDNIICGTVIR